MRVPGWNSALTRRNFRQAARRGPPEADGLSDDEQREGVDDQHDRGKQDPYDKIAVEFFPRPKSQKPRKSVVTHANPVCEVTTCQVTHLAPTNRRKLAPQPPVRNQALAQSACAAARLRKCNGDDSVASVVVGSIPTREPSLTLRIRGHNSSHPRFCSLINRSIILV